MTISRGWILAALAACAGAPAAKVTAPAPIAPAAAATPAPQTDDSLVGVIDQPAPPWQVSQWFNSPPLTLEQLRGKVVLVRWFTGPSCPFCSGTAPTLRALHERYADKGLVVVGMYHHKDDTPLDPEQVEGWIKHYGYRFPVAIDKDWTTIRKWWLDGHERGYTSPSFLIDKTGVVRRVHLGGLIAPEGPDIAAIDADVERLLAQ
ncbi:MAG TPA: redoxin domain-containing protein [Kofleriaceae bacterium]|jgi:thiol-disulfide isomerase/thioredoxin